MAEQRLVGLSSTRRPRYMTAVRSATWRHDTELWVMMRIEPRAGSGDRSAVDTSPWIDTSRPAVCSSAMTSSRLERDARRRRCAAPGVRRVWGIAIGERAGSRLGRQHRLGAGDRGSPCLQPGTGSDTAIDGQARLRADGFLNISVQRRRTAASTVADAGDVPCLEAMRPDPDGGEPEDGTGRAWICPSPIRPTSATVSVRRKPLRQRRPTPRRSGAVPPSSRPRQSPPLRKSTTQILDLEQRVHVGTGPAARWQARGAARTSAGLRCCARASGSPAAALSKDAPAGRSDEVGQLPG